MATERRPWATWTDTEDEILRSMAGDTPWAFLPAAYRRWAKSQGLPYRSDAALSKRLVHHKCSRMPCGSWFTARGLAGLLEIDPKTVRRWVRSGWLPATKRWHGPEQWMYIRRVDLRDMAREHPETLRGLDRERLFFVLEDEGLADELAGHPRGRSGRRCPVVCVETGQRFGSVAAAARSVFVTRCTLSEAIQRGGRAAGRHWRAAA